MKKLLHERLREVGKNEVCTWPILFSVTGTDDALYSTFANDLADEIEKYYIPRPRFEDGEPVQFGDEVEPDSLEKILVDMMGDNHMRGTSYIRRIQSLMERDA